MKSKKRILKITKYIVLTLIVLTAVLFCLRAAARHMIYEQAVSDNAVSRLETLNLGGEEQQVLIEGKSEELPVLIMLHGGPQSPIIYGTGYRGDTPELTENFIVVYWDLWGCGKNFTPDTESVTLKDQTDMVCDLVEAVKAEYPDHPLYLFGYSNATILTMEAAKSVEKDLAGIINLGPITSLKDAHELAYQVLMETDLSYGDRQAVQESYERNDLEGFSKLEEMVTLRTSKMFYWREPLNNTRVLAYFMRVFYSPDYSLGDIYHAYYASIFGGSSFKTLREQNYEADEKEAMQSLDIPLLIIQSEGDIYAPRDFLEQLAHEKENVTYIIQPRSAHLPTNTGFEDVNRALIDFAE